MRWLNRPGELPHHSWLLQASAPLLALPADVVGAHGAAEGSASIRLLRPKTLIRAGRGGIGMMMVQAGRPDTAFLPSPDRLTKHLDERLGWWVGEWAAMLHALVPGFIPDGRRLVTIAIDRRGDRNATAIAACLGKLTACVREERT